MGVLKIETSPGVFEEIGGGDTSALEASVAAIEAELGVNPSGASATVADRFAALGAGSSVLETQVFGG